jgi:hypothetical protein
MRVIGYGGQLGAGCVDDAVRCSLERRRRQTKIVGVRRELERPTDHRTDNKPEEAKGRARTKGKVNGDLPAKAVAAAPQRAHGLRTLSLR